MPHEVADDDAFGVLDAAVESGVTFLDTADVYGDGRSERLIGRFLAEREDRAHGLTIATKMGRRADPHNADAYTLDAFRIAFLTQVPLWLLGAVMIVFERRRTRVHLGLDAPRRPRR